MLQDHQTTCWVVTEGKAGMESQCLGLAAALGVAPTIKRVKLRSPWRELSPYLRAGLRCAYSAKGDPVAAPWPDLLIACGRAAVPAALRARQAGSLTVYVQNPVISSSHFDLVVAPQHDRVKGSNVMATIGSLNSVTPELLQHAADRLRPFVQHLPAPRIAVIIGGSNAVYRMTPREMGPLTIQLAEMVKTQGGSLLVTASRRTGESNALILQAGLHDVPGYIWDGQGPNPYHGMLGLADAILVTCDSVNMVSEAAATGKPVHIIDLPGGSDKFRRFHQVLRDKGITRPFLGRIETWSYPPLNEAQTVAARVRDMLNARKAYLGFRPPWP